MGLHSANLNTGKLVAGPFESVDWVGAIRFSPDSKKLAVNSWTGKCLEVQTQDLDIGIPTTFESGGIMNLIPFNGQETYTPLFWTKKAYGASLLPLHKYQGGAERTSTRSGRRAILSGCLSSMPPNIHASK